MTIRENPAREGLRYEVWDTIFGRPMVVAAFVTRELAEEYYADKMYGPEL